MAREVSILPFNLDDLLHCRGVESERVEFKATWDPRTTGPQVLRTICAFANDFHNLNGGYVVIGVDERDGRGRLPPRGLSEAQVDAAQKWIRGQCNRLDPPYAPVLSPERVGQRFLLVVWAPASDMRPHQAPTGAMGSGEKGTRRYFVRLGSETVDAQRHPHLLRGLVEQTARVPWDDRALRQARQEDMREAKVREFLREVGSGLLDEPDAREIFRRLRLVLRVNDHEVPRNIGVLCFSNDPTQWFRGAAIQVVRFTAGAAGDVQEERVFRGALVDQVRDCLAYLRNLSAVYFHKQADDIHTQRTASYPFAALQGGAGQRCLPSGLRRRSAGTDQGLRLSRSRGDRELSRPCSGHPTRTPGARCEGNPGCPGAQPPHRRVLEGVGLGGRPSVWIAENLRRDGRQRLA